MKKTKTSKILTPEEKKRKKRKLAIVLSAVFLTPIVCVSVAIGAFAIWASNQKPNADLLPTATASPTFFDIDGNELDYTDDNYINPSDVPADLKNAFVALEDKRFYSHKGYDPVRMAGALLSNIKAGSLKEGASTITQQLVKNTHLSHEKTVSRKLKEIAIASNLEREYSKDEILAMYLSVIYFGNGAYGVKQAARLYFDKNVTELDLSECATLAGIVKNPKKYSPFSNETDCISRRNLVLTVMKNEGYIDEQTYSNTISSPLNSTKHERKNGNLNSQIYYLYIKNAIDEVCEKLDMTKYELSNSALEIYLNLDANLQKQIAASGQDKSMYSTDSVNGAIIAIDNKNHAVSAYWSNLPYNVKRQPGSSLKPLAVYAPAIDRNEVTLATPITDEKVVYGDFSPSNFGGIYYGDTTIRQAIKKSMNSISVKTLSYIGVDAAVGTLANLGIQTEDADKNYALSLGALTNGVAVKEIADAYATFANDGHFKKADFVRYVVKNDRKILSSDENLPKKVFKSSTCDQLNSALSDTVQDGTAIALSALDFEVCAKTGTAQRADKMNSDAWCASYNNDYTVVVWHGSDSGMDEKGGGFATRQCQKTWRYIENKQPIAKKLTTSEFSVVLDVDLYATKQNKSVTIASESTPLEYRKSEIFSIDNQYRMSSCFDSVDFNESDVDIAKNGKEITLTLNTKEIYSYRIYRIDALGREQIAVFDAKTVEITSISDKPLAFDSIVKYEIVCFITSNPQICRTIEKEVYVDGYLT